MQCSCADPTPRLGLKPGTRFHEPARLETTTQRPDNDRIKKHLLDLVTFQGMISPVVLQIMFWPAAIASVYYSAWLIREGNAIGWIPLIVGNLPGVFR